MLLLAAACCCLLLLLAAVCFCMHQQVNLHVYVQQFVCCCRRAAALVQQLQQICIEKICCPLFQVDAHNIVPVWLSSNKQEVKKYMKRYIIVFLYADFYLLYSVVFCYLFTSLSFYSFICLFNYLFVYFIYLYSFIVFCMHTTNAHKCLCSIYAYK